MASPPKKKIVVTGFGPFGKYAENPSSIVVSKLSTADLPPELSHKFEIETRILPVDYNHVDKQFVGTEQGHFYIHVGVHPVEKLVRIECQSQSDGYCSKDINGTCPADNRPCNAPKCGSADVMQTNLDCDKVVSRLRALIGDNGLRIEKSEDPGQYLCGYVYYSTLKNNNGNSLFVHIPVFDEVSTPELMEQVLGEIIQQVILQCP